MKNVKKLLARYKSEILPDEKIKDNIKRELGFDDKECSLVYANGGERVADSRRRNKIITVCASALIVILVLGILIPVLLNKHRDTEFPSIVNKFTQITDADSFYAYGAVSVGTILSSSFSQSVSPSTRSVCKIVSASVPEKTNSAKLSAAADNDPEQLANVNRYMPLVESLLSEKKIEASSISGEYGYNYGMTATYTDLRGISVSYRLFYDKFPIKTDSDDDKSKKNYSISGILLIGTAEYPAEGLYKTETEDDETESDLYFKAFTNADKTSYIEARHKYETEKEKDKTEIEQEFVYSVYKNNKLIERTVVEYESEKDDLELKMSISKDGKTDTLKFKGKIENGKNILIAKGIINGQSLRFRVLMQQDGYRYVFDDGSFSDLDRDDVDDDDDDDDDDDSDDDADD